MVWWLRIILFLALPTAVFATFVWLYSVISGVPFNLIQFFLTTPYFATLLILALLSLLTPGAVIMGDIIFHYDHVQKNPFSYQAEQSSGHNQRRFSWDQTAVIVFFVPHCGYPILLYLLMWPEHGPYSLDHLIYRPFLGGLIFIMWFVPGLINAFHIRLISPTINKIISE